MEKAKKSNKSISLIIYFDRLESSAFGGVNAQLLRLLLPEEEANKVIEQFKSQEGILSVNLGDGRWRHINAQNILYIDEQEVIEETNQ